MAVMSFFTGLIIIFIPFFLLYLAFRWRIPKGLTLFVGVPGSGKTTLCARAKILHEKSLKHKKHKYGDTFFCNVPILGASKITLQDMGVNLIENGVLCFDESGIELNNRNYKNLSKNVISFAKLYRHYGIRSFMLFSQGMDTDITFVRLADRIAVVTKSHIPYFIQVRYAKKVVGIDELTHQLVDQYQWRLLGRKLVFAPTCWSHFDTYESPTLPVVKFPIFNYKTRWNNDTEESAAE